MSQYNSTENTDYRINKGTKRQGIMVDLSANKGLVRNLTQDVVHKPTIVGRDVEIKWIMRRLLCCFRPNILLVGFF